MNLQFPMHVQRKVIAKIMCLALASHNCPNDFAFGSNKIYNQIRGAEISRMCVCLRLIHYYLFSARFRLQSQKSLPIVLYPPDSDSSPVHVLFFVLLHCLLCSFMCPYSTRCAPQRMKCSIQDSADFDLQCLLFVL